MDKLMANYLLDYAAKMHDDATKLFETSSGYGSVSSIIRQAAWKIEAAVPEEHRAAHLALMASIQ